jgi:hypothetical protein
MAPSCSCLLLMLLQLPPKLILLDTGMIAELSDRDQVGLIQFFKALTQQDGEMIGKVRAEERGKGGGGRGSLRSLGPGAVVCFWNLLYCIRCAATFSRCRQSSACPRLTPARWVCLGRPSV